jgi:hypothetical protein
VGEFRPSVPGERRGGRQKGTPNKVDNDIKRMVLRALDGVGGHNYLMRQAEQNPGPFLALVGKVLPLQLAGDPDRPLAISFEWAPATPVAQAVSHETTIEVEAEPVEIEWSSDTPPDEVC